MKKRVIGVLARLIAVLVLVIGGVAIAAPAQAATCSGDSCSGLDPESTGCSSGAYTATSFNNSQFSLEVRYSPTCKTNWTRLTMYSPGLFQCSMSGWMYAVQDSGYTRQKYFDSLCGNASVTRWTEQIYSPVRKVQGRFVDQNGVTYVTPWA